MRLKQIHDDSELFMVLTLEISAAGLNRKMIQNKKEDYQKAFFNFDVEKVAEINDKDVNKLLDSESKIIKNKRKIDATINNAKRIRVIQEEFGSFDKYIWKFVERKGIINHDSIKGHWIRNKLMDDLKYRGFTFVGPTAVHAFLIVIGVLSYTKKQEEEYNRGRGRKKNK